MTELHENFDVDELDAMGAAGEHLARNIDEIKRMIAIVRRATSRGGWWDGPRGMAATKALQGWGAVERERLITGDPTAEPKSVGGGGSGARSRRFSTRSRLWWITRR